MKKVLAFTTAFIFLAAASPFVKGEKDNGYTQGKTIYQQNCQMCHGANGKGDGPLSASFTDRPADFTNPDFWKNTPEKTIKNAVEKGYRLMPPINLSSDQAIKVAEYISAAFKK